MASALPTDLDNLVRSHTRSNEQMWVDYLGKILVDKLRENHGDDTVKESFFFGGRAYQMQCSGEAADPGEVEIYLMTPAPIYCCIKWDSLRFPWSGSAEEQLQALRPELTKFFKVLQRTRECSTCQHVTDSDSGYCRFCLKYYNDTPCKCGHYFGKLTNGLHEKCE